MLQYLPTKLAGWIMIGENMQEELGFPDRDLEDPHKWSVS
jgi:hypothetical protein